MSVVHDPVPVLKIDTVNVIHIMTPDDKPVCGAYFPTSPTKKKSPTCFGCTALRPMPVKAAPIKASSLKGIDRKVKKAAPAKAIKRTKKR